MLAGCRRKSGDLSADSSAGGERYPPPSQVSACMARVFSNCGCKLQHFECVCVFEDAVACVCVFEDAVAEAEQLRSRANREAVPPPSACPLTAGNGALKNKL